MLVFYFTFLSSKAAFVKNVDGLRITKKEIKLDSFLNKKYRLYKYTLKNKGDYAFAYDIIVFESKWI